MEAAERAGGRAEDGILQAVSVSRRSHFGRVAQLAEQVTLNHLVVGSSPTALTITKQSVGRHRAVELRRGWRVPGRPHRGGRGGSRGASETPGRSEGVICTARLPQDKVHSMPVQCSTNSHGLSVIRRGGLDLVELGPVRAPNPLEETSREFANPMRLAPQYGFRLYEIPADSYACRSRQNEVCGVLLSDASGSDQPYAREKQLEGSNVTDTAEQRTLKNLDAVRARFPAVMISEAQAPPEESVRCQSVSAVPTR